MLMGAGGSRHWTSSLLLAVATATTRRRSYPSTRETPARGPLYFYHGLLRPDPTIQCDSRNPLDGDDKGRGAKAHRLQRTTISTVRLSLDIELIE